MKAVMESLERALARLVGWCSQDDEGALRDSGAATKRATVPEAEGDEHRRCSFDTSGNVGSVSAQRAALAVCGRRVDGEKVSVDRDDGSRVSP